MAKADLIERVYANFEYSKAEVAEIVEGVLDLVKATLQRGENVKVHGFGHFKVREKADRKGRNPQTGENITISGRKIVTFSPSPLLKAAMNEEGGA